MILIRATTLSETTAAFAEDLAAGSGLPVAFVLDGRHPVTVESPRPKVMVTQATCEALGLYCPPDFAWRCGDYGIYLARAQFPDASHFWLLEYDIRLAGGPPSRFFETFAARPDIDLLACRYRAAGTDWDWYGNALGRGVKPHRCLFGVVRLSARAIDVLAEKRRMHGHSAQRRKTWPNDEGFVATTLSNGDFLCQDINAFGREFYDDVTLSLTIPIRGETFTPDPSKPGARIYHPVLFGADFDRGNRSADAKPSPPLTRRLMAKIRRQLNALSAW